MKQNETQELTHKEKVIIITGAAGGIGRASSILLAEKGAKTVLVDFNEDEGNKTLNLVREQGGEGIFVQADVSKVEDVMHYIDKTIETYGKLDVLFNNAGIIQKFSRFADIEVDHFEK